MPTRHRCLVEALENRRLLAAFDVLVFSRTTGFRHDSIDEGIAAIQALGTANDFTVTATEDPTRFTAAGLAPYEAVVFLSTTGDVLNATQQTAFEQYIASGRGYVGIHSAADTEYNWPWYGGLVGAYFDSHPAIQQATIKVADRVHPATAPLPQRWTRTDEWYNYRLNPRGKVHVLATLDESTYSGGNMGFDHPIAWTQEYGGGRSFYTGLGHTAGSYGESLFRQHLLGGIRYAAGAEPGDGGATVNTNFRKTVLDDDTTNPFQLEVAPDGRVFFIERGGALKRWTPATNTTTTLGTIPVFAGAEDGLLGLALDPSFTTNGQFYVFYSAPTVSEQRVSRFTLKNAGTQIDMASERILIRVPVQRTNSNHSAGSLAFGPGGLLYIATGDNTNPFESTGYAPIDERPGRSDWDAQKSSSNANDLRGKILRIRPELNGNYSIPAGNLFPANGPAGRPEIYAMGVRNPFRFSVDPETGWLYWGDVGPDAGADSPTRGPQGHDEINQARAAGNYGWPYFNANNRPYIEYDFATGTPGAPYNPAAPVNNSPNNTGPAALPPAQPAWIWYPYGPSATFPQVGSGGRTAMAGPVYHYNGAVESPFKLPKYYDDTLFIYEWSRNWIKEVKVDAATGAVHQINPFAGGLTFNRPMDIEIGPDGAMYVIEWGNNFGGDNPDAQIVRVDYLANTPPPISEVYVRGTEWTGPFKSYLENKGLGDDAYGYRLFGTGRTPPAQNPHDVLPWINVDQIVVRYATIPAGSGVPTTGTLTVTGQENGAYNVTSVTPVSGDPAAYVLRLAKPLGGGNPATGAAPSLTENGDRITLSVQGLGANFRLPMNVVQGDTDHLNEGVGGDHVVLARDYAEVKKRFFKSTTSALAGNDTDYTPFHDIDGNGQILARDYAEVKKRFFDSLPRLPSPLASARLDRDPVTAEVFGSAPVL